MIDDLEIDSLDLEFNTTSRCQLPCQVASSARVPNYLPCVYGVKNWQDWPCLMFVFVQHGMNRIHDFSEIYSWICYIYNLTRLCCRNCIFRVLRWKLTAWRKDLRSTFKFREWILDRIGSPLSKINLGCLAPRNEWRLQKLHFLRFQNFTSIFLNGIFQGWIPGILKWMNQGIFLEFIGFFQVLCFRKFLVFPAFPHLDGFQISDLLLKSQTGPMGPMHWAIPISSHWSFASLKIPAQVRRDPPFQRIRRQWSFPMFGHPL